MDTRTVLNTFFDPQDQDAFARSLGWQDAAQMIYYEDMVTAEQSRIPHELDKVDPREVYEQEVRCSCCDEAYYVGVY